MKKKILSCFLAVIMLTSALLASCAQGEDPSGGTNSSGTGDVTPPPKEDLVSADGITLNKSELLLFQGESELLMATVFPDEATDKSVTWATSNEKIALISQDGTVTALEVGEADITVSTANGKTAVCRVTVKANGMDFKTLTVNGNTVSGVVPNAVKEFSFINEISVRGNASFMVCLDHYGIQSVLTKTVPLNCGDNVFYILQSVDDNITVYTVTIRRKSLYTVSFDTADGTAVPAQTIEEGNLAVTPTDVVQHKGYTFTGWDYDFTNPIHNNITISARWSSNPYVVTYNANGGTVSESVANVTYGAAYTLATPTRTGYTFAGWYHDNTFVPLSGTWQIAERVTLTAKWNANSDTAYRVEHYLENLDGTYELKDTDNLTGISNGNVTPEVKNYANFTAPEKQTVTILPDGSLIVKYYYTRIRYTVTYVTNGGETMEPQMLKYGATLPAAIQSGFTFGGFYSDIALTQEIKTVPAQAITVYAKWLEESPVSAFRYYESGNSIIIKKYVSDEIDVTIPTYIGGKAVTVIEESAFSGCTGLTSITIPNSVTVIEESVFSGCTGLTSITIPNSVTVIEESAFSGCTGLTSIAIPNSVTAIEKSAFDNCNKLNAVYINSIEAWCKISFSNNTSHPLYYAHNLYLNGSLVTELVIPDSITSIGNYAFYNCNQLTSITIPNSITSIGNSAFSSCSSLISITIPNSVTSIGNYAFSGCYKLVEVINRSSLAITADSFSFDYGGVGRYAKEVHNGESKIVNKNGYLFYTVDNVNYLLGYVGSETSLTLPADYNGENYVIYQYAFYNCKQLTSNYGTEQCHKHWRLCVLWLQYTG